MLRLRSAEYSSVRNLEHIALGSTSARVYLNLAASCVKFLSQQVMAKVCQHATKGIEPQLAVTSRKVRTGNREGIENFTPRHNVLPLVRKANFDSHVVLARHIRKQAEPSTNFERAFHFIEGKPKGVFVDSFCCELYHDKRDSTLYDTISQAPKTLFS